MVSHFKDITEGRLQKTNVKSEKIYKTIAPAYQDTICLLDHEYRYLLIEGDIGKNMVCKEKL